MTTGEREREKAMKKTLKRVSIILVTVAMSVGLCVGLAACGSSASNDEQMIRSELDKAFGTLKNPTEDSIKELTGGDLSDLDEMKQYGVDPIDMIKHLFGKFDYSIDNVKVDGDKAVATVTMTNVDIQAVVNETMSTLENDSDFIAQVQQAYTSGSMTDAYKLVFDKMFEAIDNSDKLVTSTSDFELEKKDGQWDFTDEAQQQLVHDLFGGMDLTNM